MSGPARRRRQLQQHLLLVGVLAVVGTLSLWLLAGRPASWPWWLGCWLASANVLAFIFYGYDKRCARAGSQRIPEAVLHTLTAVGGSLGSFAAMRLFRHKTIKGKFQILFWCIVVLQVSLVLLVLRFLLWERGG
jgi:uncharacterized membrane protein YsdA (DUF1294 family)